MPTYLSPIGARQDASEAWKPNESGLRNAASGTPSIRNHPDATDGNRLYLWSPKADNYTSEATFNPANWDRLGLASSIEDRVAALEAQTDLLPAPAVTPLNIPTDATAPQPPQTFSIPKEFEGKPTVQVVVTTNDRRPDIERPANTTIVAGQLDTGTVNFTGLDGVYFYEWTITDTATEWQVSSKDTHATLDNQYGSVTGVVPWYENETTTFDNGGPHVPTDAYKTGNVVQDSGKLYVALQDAPAGTPLTDAAFWVEVSGTPATAEVTVDDGEFIDVPDTLYVSNDAGTLSFGDVTDVDGNGDAWVDGWTTSLKVDVQVTVRDPYGAAEYAGSTDLTDVVLVPGTYKMTWRAGPETWLIEQTSVVIDKLDHGAPFAAQAVYPGNHLVTHQFVTPGGPVYLLQSLADTAPTDAPGSDWAVNSPGLPLQLGGLNYRTGMTMTQDGVMYVRTSHQLPVTVWDAAEQARWDVVGAAELSLSLDNVDVANYTGTADAATTQGIYRHTGAPLGGAPTTNFVWTLDVDVFGNHIKQTFSPMDTGTTVLGYWVRRSFDGGGSWTAWAGR